MAFGGNKRELLLEVVDGLNRSLLRAPRHQTVATAERGEEDDRRTRVIYLATTNGTRWYQMRNGSLPSLEP